MGILKKLASYIPTVWKTGDIITAEKLNNMESGISDSGLFLVNITEDDTDPNSDPVLICDKTFQEIQEAIEKGSSVYAMIILEGNGFFPVKCFNFDETVTDMYIDFCKTLYGETEITAVEIIYYHYEDSDDELVKEEFSYDLGNNR